MKDKTLIKEIFHFLLIIMSVLFMLAGAVAIYQAIIIDKLEASLVEKDTTIAGKDTAIAGKDMAITGLKAMVQKLKSDMDPMADQAATQQKIIEELTYQIFQYITMIRKIYTRWNCFEGNFCTDGTIVADTWEWIKTAKAEAEAEAEVKAEAEAL